jgi:peptide/nickel transport system permease protein
MLAYLIRRLLLMAVTLLGVSIAIFLLLRIVPGNIADILFDSAGMIDPAEKAKIVSDLGLDLPLPVQYWHWLSGLFHGDLGYSYVSEKPVIEEILPRIPITARLAGLALTFAICAGVPLGVISAVRQNTKLDYFLRILSLSGLSMPAFWLGLLILMACVKWFGSIPIYDRAPATFGAWLAMLAIPAASVGFRSSALIMRLTRSSMLEVLRQDFVRTARAKGLRETLVFFRHALRNALLPFVTSVGITTGYLLGGAIVVEQVFAIPGLGRLILGAIAERNYPLVQASILLATLAFLAINALVDILYVAVDPRLRKA